MVTSKTLCYIQNNNKLFTLTAVKELTYGGIDQVRAMEWKKFIEQVQSKFEREVSGLKTGYMKKVSMSLS